MISRISNWLSPQGTSAPSRPWISTIAKIAVVAAGVSVAGWALYKAYNAPSEAISAALPASGKLFQAFAARPVCLDSASSKIWAAFAALSTATCPNGPCGYDCPVDWKEVLGAMGCMSAIIGIPLTLAVKCSEVMDRVCKKTSESESKASRSRPEDIAEESARDFHDGMGAPESAYAYGSTPYGSSSWDSTPRAQGSSSYAQSNPFTSRPQQSGEYLRPDYASAFQSFQRPGQWDYHHGANAYSQGPYMYRQPFVVPPAPSSPPLSREEMEEKANLAKAAAERKAEEALKLNLAAEEKAASIAAEHQERTIVLPKALQNLPEALCYLGFDSLPNIKELTTRVRKLVLENHPDKIERLPKESDIAFQARQLQANQKTQMINCYKETIALVIKYTPQAARRSIPAPSDFSRTSGASSSAAAAAKPQVDVDSCD